MAGVSKGLPQGSWKRFDPLRQFDATPKYGKRLSGDACDALWGVPCRRGGNPAGQGGVRRLGMRPDA